MRIRVILSASATALLAASCAQTEPQVLSEAPRSASATELTSQAEESERETQQGRFIARCATEADGGTPGMTFFTDGTQNVTDHCLSRYYIGVQPAPGALYVADEHAGTYVPIRPTESEPTTNQWTPAQPRTDTGARDPQLEDSDGREPGQGEPGQGEAGADDSDDVTTPGTPETSPDGSTPTTVPPTTTPGETGPTTPGQVEPTNPGETDPSAPGSTEPAPTEVPTVTETPRAPAPAPQGPALPPFGWPGSQGSFGLQGSAGSQGSEGLAPLPLPAPVRPSS